MGAYSLKSYQMEGPVWLRTTHYEVIAKIPDGCGRRDVPAMLRRLLRERFALKVHEESREQSVFALSVDSDGPKLKKSEAPTPQSGTAGGRDVTVTISNSGRLSLRRASLGDLAEMLSGSLGKPVLDLTGIAGEFDIDLYVDPPRALQISMDAAEVRDQTGSMDFPVYAGLRALGLRLVPRKAPIKYTIVDGVERIPIPN
jgi:uncharacterized protein (TIGR03435 family)